MTQPISPRNGTQPIGQGATATAPFKEPVPAKHESEVAAIEGVLARLYAKDAAVFGHARAATPAAERVDNTAMQLGGANPLEDGIGEKAVNLVGKVPGLEAAPELIQKFARVGGPAAAVATFGYSAWNTIHNWDHLTTSAKVLNGTSTAAAGLAAGGAVATTGLFGATAARIGGAVLGPAAGVAGTIMSGINAYKEFQDPTKTAGQRGMAVTSTVLQGVGTALCFTPLAPLGIGLMVVGGIVGFAGDWLGKIPFVNSAFQAIGDGIGAVAKVATKVWDGAKKVVSGVVDGAKKVVSGFVDGAKNVVGAVGDFFSSL